MSDPALVLGHVRLHGHRADAISARWWLERALDGTGRAAGLAPGEILIVRRLRHAPPTPRSVQRWGQGLDHQLACLALRAARAASGPVPASCEAVLFADQPELLACLACDWLEGRVAECWWWSLRTGDGTEFLLAQWTSRAKHVPAAIDVLAANRLHVAFARRLDRRVVLAITHAVARAWGARWLAVADSAPPCSPPLRPDFMPSPVPAAPVPPASASAASAPAPPSPAPRRRSPPWRELAPGLEDERLDPDRELLLGSSLLLHCAPALALATPTADRVRRWLEWSHAAWERRDAAPTTSAAAATGPVDAAEIATRTIRPPASMRALADGPTPGGPILGADPSPLRGRSGRGGGASNPVRMHDSTNVPAGRRAPRPAVRTLDPVPAIEPAPPHVPDPAIPGHPAPRPRIRAASVGATTEPPAPVTAGPTVSVRPEVRPPELADTSPSKPPRAADDTPPSPLVSPRTPHESLTTEIGGILLLLNIAVHLGHYGDFTSPQQSGIVLSPWDWLALVGRYLLPRQAGRDRAWRLLAELAGRGERQPPGEGFRPPTAWRMPPSWLALPRRAPASWSWGIYEDRIVVRHPLGFVVLDLPAHADPMRQLERELARYRRVVGTIVILPGGPPRYPASSRRLPPALVRWRSWIGAYVAVRLRLALGASSRRQASTQALCRRARICCADGRLDAWFSLDELPVSIRVAGLDRNPGWIPATGLTIAFHYD